MSAAFARFTVAETSIEKPRKCRNLTALWQYE
jgi:hypothetical protein